MVEAFLWSISFVTDSFSQILSYVTRHRILGLFFLLGIVSLFLSALTGAEHK